MQTPSSPQAPRTQSSSIRTLVIVLIILGGLVMLLVLGVVAVGGVGAYIMRQKEAEALAKMAAEEAESRRVEQEKRELDQRPKDSQSKIDSLLTQLASAKDEATRKALQRQLDEELAKQKGARPGSTGGRGAAKPCECAPDDPLCSCL